MEVIHPRVALLSNVEVLALLHELDADHIARAKTAIRIKKEEDSSGKPSLEPHTEEVSENLRTIELETIRYLSAEYQPTSFQSAHAVSRLVRDLAPFSLTKAERLQIVNLAPTEPVELYVIVEELEDRLGGRMDEILTIVSMSLSPTPVATSPQSPSPTSRYSLTQTANPYEMMPVWEDYANDAGFEDFGEGVEAEDNLDLEDED